MKPEYQIDVTDAFFMEVLRRRRRDSRFRWLRVLLKVLAGTVVLVACVSSLLRGWWGMAIFWGALVVLLMFVHHVDLWVARRRFRLSPMRGERVRLYIEADGLRSESPKHQSMLMWSRFTHAKIFHDGIELHMEPGLAQWLPDTAIVAGTRAEIESLIPNRLVRNEKGEQSLAAESR